MEPILRLHLWENRCAEEVCSAVHCSGEKSFPIAGVIEVVFDEPYMAVTLEPRLKEGRKASKIDEAIVKRVSPLLFLEISSGKCSPAILWPDDEVRSGKFASSYWPVQAEKSVEPRSGLAPETPKVTQNSSISEMCEKYNSLHDLEGTFVSRHDQLPGPGL
jgi:hypothetical protein